MKKLKLLQVKVSSRTVDVFPSVSELLEEDSSITFEDIADVIVQHLERLQFAFDRYFPEDIRQGHEWIENPFSIDLTAVSLSMRMEDQLIELSCDSVLKTLFRETSIEQFWSKLVGKVDYAEIAAETMTYRYADIPNDIFV